jgi:hypothetical protein
MVDLMLLSLWITNEKSVMTKLETNRVSHYMYRTKVWGVRNASRCKQLLVTKIIPQSKKYTALGIKTYHEKLAPNIKKVHPKLVMNY